MRIWTHLASAWIMAGYFAPNTSASEASPAASARAAAEEKKAQTIYPERVKRDASSHGNPAERNPSAVPLSTSWIPADKRNQVRNLSVAYKDQDGRSGLLVNLVTRPVLITFFYTRCQNSMKCSAAVGRLASLQQQLTQAGIENNVRLLAITYEPQFDTPERINRYGSDRGLRFGENALAVQLDDDGHQRLVNELNAPVNYNAGWVNTHGVELSLLDANGRLVRKYHTLLWNNDQVLEDLRRILHE